MMNVSIIKYLTLSMPGIMTYLLVMERSHIFYSIANADIAFCNCFNRFVGIF